MNTIITDLIKPGAARTCFEDFRPVSSCLRFPLPLIAPAMTAHLAARGCGELPARSSGARS
jgi:hypothetical protein